MALENTAYPPLPPLVLAMFLTRSEYDRFVRREAAGSRVGSAGPGPGPRPGFCSVMGRFGNPSLAGPGESGS